MFRLLLHFLILCLVSFAFSFSYLLPHAKSSHTHAVCDQPAEPTSVSSLFHIRPPRTAAKTQLDGDDHSCPGSISWSWRSLILAAAGLAHSAPDSAVELGLKIGGEKGRGPRGERRPSAQRASTFLYVLSVACLNPIITSSSSALPFSFLAFHGSLFLSKLLLLHLAF
ncbi:hypothetical protein GGR57DRAFT_222770 [Xylariaceae sp. FL1272]|nr:hypothetical protein GGR57DRAFT_222770 [Xylariaceae sp. FL1272]